MFFKVLRVLLVISAVLVGYNASSYLSRSPYAPLIGMFVGAVIGLLILLIEAGLQRYSGQTLVAGVVGLIVGLIVANLVAPAVLSIVKISWYIHIMLVLIFAYLGIVIAVRKMDEIPFLSRMKVRERVDVSYKVLDTSVIIDGRIADIYDAGFIDGILVIPEFVLKELQMIADSHDSIKRNRGRRGLEILKTMQKKIGDNIKIVSEDFPDVREVDAKLIKLTDKLGASLITNDFNLNRVAELQGLKVLNINELANAIKPVVLPGEVMHIYVLKEGKEYDQGVGYLDDGTLVVVENGRKHIGSEIDVVVTSVLQTTAGRMIFTKPRDEVE
ncbi:MAG TPA: PIN domain nuclease [Firmicutes bacterium]|nr:MAG: PIN domain nuclease [Candidatus Coatesbacteria bacterium]HEC80192.1 PIN domain nuclease [Bacillota bacterium]